MKTLISIAFLFFSMAIFAQKDEVMNKLAEYNFSEKFLTENLKDADAERYFEARITTVTSTETKVEEAFFDPKREIGDRWQLRSVNGNTPSKKELNQFDKAHNTTQPDINGEVDDNSWKIVTDNNDYLVIEFAYDKSTLPKKYAFLADCVGQAFLNKGTKRLEKASFINTKPIKIKIFNVSKLEMDVIYQYDETDKVYLISNEQMLIKTKLLGQDVEINESQEFYNYQKI